MSTTAQAIANKQNAQQSTGPRTPEGKSQSSLNSLRHGLTGQSVVLPGEDAESYAAFRAKVFAETAPVGCIEEIHAQTVTDTQWRLERARGLEASLIALARYEPIPEAIAAIEDSAERQAMLQAHGFDKRAKILHNLQLQEARLQRTLFKATAELQRLQSARVGAIQENLRQAIIIRKTCEQQHRAFVAADFGFVFTTEQIDAAEVSFRGSGVARAA